MIKTRFQVFNLFFLLLFIAKHLQEVSSQENLCKYRSSFCPADDEDESTYRGANGWATRYEWCKQKKQSPINIRTEDVEKDETLSPLDFKNYDKPVTEYNLGNRGDAVYIMPYDYTDIDRTITVYGETYHLSYLDFHFGCGGCDEGSEHTVNGASSAMEIQFFHLDDSRNKRAAVAVFAEEGEDNNDELQKIVEEFKGFKDRDALYFEDTDIDLSKLLPIESPSFYRYNGSETHPPCLENVIWSVLTEPITVGKSQLEEFRKLYSIGEAKVKKYGEDAKGCMMAGNLRPIQRLNCRTVTLYENEQEQKSISPSANFGININAGLYGGVYRGK